MRVRIGGMQFLRCEGATWKVYLEQHGKNGKNGELVARCYEDTRSVVLSEGLARFLVNGLVNGIYAKGNTPEGRLALQIMRAAIAQGFMEEVRHEEAESGFYIPSGYCVIAGAVVPAPKGHGAHSRFSVLNYPGVTIGSSAQT
jgi:hypothetical protein